MVKAEDTIQKASRGLIKDFYQAQQLLIGKTANGLLPDFNREKALSMIREDYAVQTAVSKLVDKTLENGYSFSAEDGKSNLDSFEETRKKTRFDRELRQWLYQMYGYLNCFIEVVKDGNSKVKELHTLETTQTEPIANQHGKILGYVQLIAGQDANKDAPTWKPEEVTHIKLNYMTTTVWSDIELKSIYTSVLIKQYIMAYFGWKYGTNQLRPLYSIMDANDDSISDFLSYWKRVQEDITKPLIFDGEIKKIMMAEATEESSLISVLNQMDENIYSVMHVPPIASNETGSSNRSSGDKQEQFLAVRIKAVQSVIKESFENDLFPKMGFNKIRINWKPVIKTDIGKIMEVAERMKTIGIKTDLIERYLKDEGFYNEKVVFDKEKLKLEKEALKPQEKSEDMYPSRSRKPEDETSKEIGTGVESTTRDSQLQKGTTKLTYSLMDLEKETKFAKYPYTN
jgi:hypothetical protein